MNSEKNNFYRWIPIIVEAVVVLALAVIFVFGNHLPSRTQNEPTPVPTEETLIIVPADPKENLPEPTTEPTAPPTPEPTPTIMTIDRYADWIRKLSGDTPVTIGGQEYTIKTRYSYAMFGNQDNAKASEYLLEQLAQWVPADMITYEPYEYHDAMSAYTWYNIIVTFPGTVSPDEQILYTAHYDSCVALTDVNPLELAPGANDNASGTAAIVTLAAHYAKNKPGWDMYFVAFSGEDANLRGSTFFADHPVVPLEQIKYLFNIDMIGDDNPVQYCEVSDAGMKDYQKFEAVNQDQHLFESLNRGALAANSDQVTGFIGK